MNNLKTFIFLLHIVEILSFDLSQIKFIIMSQNHTRHASFGLKTEEKLKVKLKVYCQCFSSNNLFIAWLFQFTFARRLSQ